MNRYTTGEVAKKLNLSLRTLRYYDQIGLLTPCKKEDNGKRFYDDENLLMLEKITILKMLDLPLKEIKEVLREVTIEQLLFAHRKSLEQKTLDMQKAIKHTTTLLNIYQLEGELNWEQLIPLITNARDQDKIERNWNEYFNKHEQETLKAILPKMEKNDSQIKAWMRLNKRIEFCLKRGDLPHSEEGQLLAEEALAFSEALFSDNEELANAFFEVRKSPKKSAGINLYPVSEEVLAFLEEAIEVYERVEMAKK